MHNRRNQCRHLHLLKSGLLLLASAAFLSAVMLFSYGVFSIKTEKKNTNFLHDYENAKTTPELLARSVKNDSTRARNVGNGDYRD